MDLPPGNKGRSDEERQPALECKTEPSVANPGLVREAKKLWGSISTQYQVRVNQSRLKQPAARSLACASLFVGFVPR